MAQKIILKKSSVAAKVPLSTDLSAGELAINLTDKVLYSKDASGNVLDLTSALAIKSKLGITTLSGSNTGDQNLNGYALTSHNHSGVYQPIDADLTAIAALSGTSGLLRKTAADSWSLDTSMYLISGGALGTPSSGTLSNCTFPTLNQNTTGSAGSVTNAITFATTGGATTGTTFNGAAARTIDYSTIGAAAQKGTATIYGGAKFSLTGTTLTITTT